jgi:aspartyl-tRNA(Asn)/glutamyl-tRNA(Gln) amidotransferase subunit C
MKISKEEVEKIAHLARLHLPENEVEEYQDSLSKVLVWMESLNAVDTDQVEPLRHISRIENNLREDKSFISLDKSKALSLGPDTNEDYFKVPQVKE